jgi:hypothetical protein
VISFHPAIHWVIILAGEELAKHVVAALDRSVAGSLFLDACAHHTAMGNDVWEDVAVNGVAMVDAVSDWLEQVFSPNERYKSSKSTWVAQDAFPCAKCCGAYRPSPGF